MTVVEASRPANGVSTPSEAASGGNQTTETSPQANSDAPSKVIPPEGTNDTRSAKAVTAPNVTSPNEAGTRQAIYATDSRSSSPAGNDSRPTMRATPSTAESSGGVDHAGRHGGCGAQIAVAASVQPADRHVVIDTQTTDAVGSQLDGQGIRGTQSGTTVDPPGPAAIDGAPRRWDSLLDPALAFAADVLDDIERVRIANENRLRQLTRSEEDSDGEVRGFGLDESHPDVARLAAIVGTLAEVEKDATSHLTKVMKRHPLHGWAKGMKGVGDKQIARLLAVIGDPYWRPEIVRDDDTVIPAGPRTVSALWAYCGLHTTPVGGHAMFGDQLSDASNGDHIPVGQRTRETQPVLASRDQLADRHLGQGGREAHEAGAWVAARRQRGQKANWSTTAKMRAYLIAESCSKQLRKPCTAGSHVEDCACSPYRRKYESRRAATADRLHAVECVRCGPAGKPAQPGTPWSDGHKHADALRIVAKGILKDLWRAARGLHFGGGDRP